MIIDPFHSDLHKIIHGQINDRLASLGNGACLSYDEYKKQVGYLEALTQVLQWCEEVEQERYGTKKKADVD